MRISLDNELIDFNRGGIDAAIRMGRGQWEGLRSDFLFRQHFAPICAPSFLEANQVREPADLLKAERLAPNDPMWAAWFANVGIGTPEPRQGVVLDSQLQEASAMLGGFGIALMSPLFWTADLASGRLVQPFDRSICRAPRTGWSIRRTASACARSNGSASGSTRNWRRIGRGPRARCGSRCDVGIGRCFLEQAERPVIDAARYVRYIR